MRTASVAERCALYRANLSRLHAACLGHREHGHDHTRECGEAQFNLRRALHHVTLRLGEDLELSAAIAGGQRGVPFARGRDPRDWADLDADTRAMLAALDPNNLKKALSDGPRAQLLQTGDGNGYEDGHPDDRAVPADVPGLRVDPEVSDLRSELDRARELNRALLAQLAQRDAELVVSSGSDETRVIDDVGLLAEMAALDEDAFTPAAAKRLTQVLNAEKAELRRLRKLGEATPEQQRREAEIDRLHGLLARLGEG